jgi:Probable cobalt transporter subunit (CbtA)
MVRALLIRGMLAGLAGGVLAFCFAKLFGEPQVDLAIAFESKIDAAMHMHAEPELVSRAVQSTIGLFVGVVTYATALGGLFALVFAYIYGRIGTFSPRATAAILAALGFIAIVLVPDLKYPASPPAVGHHDTIGFRTEWFFFMIAVSIAAMVLAMSLRKALAERIDAWTAAVLAMLVFTAIVAVAQFIMPTINEVPGEFPADVLWRFRVAALGIQVVMWTTLGLAFGAAAERIMIKERWHSPSALPLKA